MYVINKSHTIKTLSLFTVHGVKSLARKLHAPPTPQYNRCVSDLNRGARASEQYWREAHLVRGIDFATFPVDLFNYIKQ